MRLRHGSGEALPFHLRKALYEATDLRGEKEDGTDNCFRVRVNVDSDYLRFETGG